MLNQTVIYPKLLSKKDVAKLFNCSIRTIERLRNKGELTAYKIGGRILFKEIEIQEYLENLQQAA